MSDMAPEEFRKQGHRLVDWIAGYLDGGERYPVLSQVQPGAIRDALPTEPPPKGEPFEAIFADFEKILVPGLTHWNHPAFFAYFSISASAPGILGEFLSAALNQQAMLWRTSPSATELEGVTLSWLRQLLGLPAAFQGVIYDTASISTLHALAAARQRLRPNAREEGLHGGPPLTVYCSEDAHNSIDKAVLTLGLGTKWLRKIPTDDNFRMRPEALRDAIRADREAGYQPMAVMATVGTTSTSAIDPVVLIADICAAEKVWLHVDAAYAGPAAIAPEYRYLMNGVDRADSLVLNPHKWLFTPFDLSAFYIKDMDVLKSAFSHIPEYLKTDEGVLNLMDTGIQLGRRFRSLKLWMILRYFGAERLAAQIRSACHLASEFAEWVDHSPDFELMAPVPLSLVCFRARPAGVEDLDALNERIMAAVNATGKAFLSHTKIRGKFALRLAVGHIRTERKHLEMIWELLQCAAMDQPR